MQKYKTTYLTVNEVWLKLKHSFGMICLPRFSDWWYFEKSCNVVFHQNFDVKQVIKNNTLEKNTAL